MAWLAVNLDGSEKIFNEKPFKSSSQKYWTLEYNYGNSFSLPKGSIKRLIGDRLLKTHGKDYLSWDDDAVRFDECTS